MAVDGTWRRACKIEDISESGAKLLIEGLIEGLTLQDFLLVLSSTGSAFRRCQLAWVNAGSIGVVFLRPGQKKQNLKAARRPG
jgi:hypothetical protein